MYTSYKALSHMYVYSSEVYTYTDTCVYYTMLVKLCYVIHINNTSQIDAACLRYTHAQRYQRLAPYTKFTTLCYYIICVYIGSP